MPMSSPTTNITSVLKETRQFPPPAEFAARAHIKSTAEYDALWKKAADDPEGFWAEQAEALTWFRKWNRVLEWKEPHAKWFVGGTLNAAYNCIDRHLDGPRKNKAAIIWEGEPGDSRVLRYQDLHREVCKFANVLKSQGIRAGDRVDLHADDPGLGHRHVGLHANRRAAQHCLRRIQCGRRGRPQQRRQGQTHHHCGRRLAPRQGGSPEAERRSGAGTLADGGNVHRLQPLQSADRDEAGPRLVVA